MKWTSILDFFHIGLVPYPTVETSIFEYFLFYDYSLSFDDIFAKLINHN